MLIAYILSYIHCNFLIFHRGNEQSKTVLSHLRRFQLLILPLLVSSLPIKQMVRLQNQIHEQNYLCFRRSSKPVTHYHVKQFRFSLSARTVLKIGPVVVTSFLFLVTSPQNFDANVLLSAYISECRHLKNDLRNTERKIENENRVRCEKNGSIVHSAAFIVLY